MFLAEPGPIERSSWRDALMSDCAAERNAGDYYDHYKELVHANVTVVASSNCHQASLFMARRLYIAVCR